MAPLPANNKSGDTMVLSLKNIINKIKDGGFSMKPEDVLMFWADKEAGWGSGRTKVFHHKPFTSFKTGSPQTTVQWNTHSPPVAQPLRHSTLP